jgi:hypothetical protein
LLGKSSVACVLTNTAELCLPKANIDTGQVELKP